METLSTAPSHIVELPFQAKQFQELPKLEDTKVVRFFPFNLFTYIMIAFFAIIIVLGVWAIYWRDKHKDEMSG